MTFTVKEATIGIVSSLCTFIFYWFILSKSDIVNKTIITATCIVFLGYLLEHCKKVIYLTLFIIQAISLSTVANDIGIHVEKPYFMNHVVFSLICLCITMYLMYYFAVMVVGVKITVFDTFQYTNVILILIQILSILNNKAITNTNVENNK